MTVQCTRVPTDRTDLTRDLHFCLSVTHCLSSPHDCVADASIRRLAPSLQFSYIVFAAFCRSLSSPSRRAAGYDLATAHSRLKVDVTSVASSRCVFPVVALSIWLFAPLAFILLTASVIDHTSDLCPIRQSWANTVDMQPQPQT